MNQEDKKRLSENLKNDTTWEVYYRFGRTMPFGKYKGWYIYYMILRHHLYTKWIIENTQFKFNETELWWLDRINEIAENARLNNLLNALGAAIIHYGELPENVENPHAIVE